ncbi:MAG: beta-glucosidase [Armatimonadetes bacterium]|nr:beta-glucosidase [Armatimonadota bacterium]
MQFCDGFNWGVSTASYQIEGAANVGGRGPSVWDMLCRKPGAVWNGQSGEEACDHYHRYKEDVALMKELGVKGYRFSIAWPRVMPEGKGAINEEGLAFYDRLVDELLAAGITPWCTLYHWDTPLALYHQGGWMNPDSPEWFADYTQAVVDRLSDRISHWFTLNEQQCFIGLGMLDGVHAPGDKLAFAEGLLAAHHSMKAHGRAVQVIRARSKTNAKVGMAPVAGLFYPDTESPADIEAARKGTFAVLKKDQWQQSWWMDPIMFGHYPEDGLKLFGADAPKVKPGDMEIIQQPLDFFGMNIYHSPRVKAGPDGNMEFVPRPVGAPLTAFRWPVEPECLYWGAKFYYERYKLPIVITENGLSNQDWIAQDGKVHDPQRIDFLHRHLLQLHRAYSEGVDVQGYFQWSLMDNFEWAEGYKERFGLIYVDYPTQKRIPKDSYHWYKEVIATNGASLELKQPAIR